MSGGLGRWLRRVPLAPAVDLRGRQIIVTGTAPGSIGEATARQLAAWGADLVVTTRGNAAAVAAGLQGQLAGNAAAGTIQGHPLDLADAGSVRRFLAWYLARPAARLDVLVNNAGIHLDLLSQWRQPRLSADGQEIHWRTNYLGTLQLTLGLLPLLRETAHRQGGARIVNLVSELHVRGRNSDLFGRQRPYDSWQAYGNSKLALVHASFELQRRYGATEGLRSYCLHPGAVYTNIADRGLSGNPRLEALRRALAPIERLFLLSPEEGAQTSLYCATSPDAAGGRYYRRCWPANASPDSADQAVAARLYEQTQAWVASLSAPE